MSRLTDCQGRRGGGLESVMGTVCRWGEQTGRHLLWPSNKGSEDPDEKHIFTSCLHVFFFPQTSFLASFFNKSFCLLSLCFSLCHKHKHTLSNTLLFYVTLPAASGFTVLVKHLVPQSHKLQKSALMTFDGPFKRSGSERDSSVRSYVDFTHTHTHTGLCHSGSTLRLLPPLDRRAMVLLQHGTRKLWLRSEHPDHYTWLQNTTRTQFTRIYCCNVAIHSEAYQVLIVRVSVIWLQW